MDRFYLRFYYSWRYIDTAKSFNFFLSNNFLRGLNVKKLIFSWRFWNFPYFRIIHFTVILYVWCFVSLLVHIICDFLFLWVLSVQTHLPSTVEQLLHYKSPMPRVSVASVLNQRLHLTRQPFYLSKTNFPKPPYWNNSVIWMWYFPKKNAIIRKSTF